MTQRIAVVGAGITGITTAYYLARAGYAVEVFDEEPHPAMRTSYANGGQISVSNSEVWTTWSNVKKGIRWMFQKDAPLLIGLTPSWRKIKWLAQFLRYTARGDYAANTAETIRMGLESRQLYKQIIEQEGLEFDQRFEGILHFYKDNTYFANAWAAKELYESNGCQWEMVDAHQIKQIEPKLKNRGNIVGGAWTKDDWTGDIHKFCMQLATVLRERYGVQFTFGKRFTASDAAYFDAVVISAGVGSVELAREYGDELSIYPVKGYSITINNVDPAHLPTVSLLDDQAKIVTSTLGNRFRVAGTAELADENYDIRHDRIKPLLNWVRTNFPQIDTSDYSSWACLRPMTPNMMPIVKKSDWHTKVFYNTGHGHLGWTLAAYTADRITQIVKDTV